MPGLNLAADFYVSPKGDDANPGTQSRPFATLEGAQKAVRKFRQNGRPREGSVTVFLRAGDYLRTNALVLTSADSGAPGTPIVWRSFGNEKARLLGGRRVSGFLPVKERSVRERLEATAREHILQVDLRQMDLKEFGALASRGFARPLSTAHCELFFNGKPMTLARWPNEGEWERIEGFPKASSENDGHGGNIGSLANGFIYKGDRPGRWLETTNIWVHGYWAWDWANSYERIVSLDREKRLIQTAPPHGNYGFRQGQRFYFLNVLEELDRPGEWFLDGAAGVLYFWPPEPLQASSEILISILNQPLLKFTEVSHVGVKGLVLEATRANAVEIEGGAHNEISECRIRNIGNSGVVVRGGTGHHIAACDIFDTGDGGVILEGGDRQSLRPAEHHVVDCHFARQGRWSKCYVPAVLMEGVGMVVSHNLIHEHPHCAILFTGNDHQIEFNEIHHIALETGDVGAIYSGRNYTYRGNRIRYNYIHHTGGVGMGSMGIYMDDCVSGTEMFGNIFYKVQRAAFLGGGRDHQVVNNVFVDCNHAVELDGRGLDTSPVWRDMVDKTMRQSLTNVPLSLYRDRYPALKTLDAYYGAPQAAPIEGTLFHGVPPENNIVATNVCVGKWLSVGWHAKVQMLRLENNLTNAEPWFRNQLSDASTARDFDLPSDSPGWKLGFQRIPVEKIGPRRKLSP